MPNQFLSPEGDLENYFVTEYWLIDQYVGDTLWVWGNAQFGRLGINSTLGSKSTPVTTSAGGTNWKQISMGNSNAAAIKTDGTLWTWGGAIALGNNSTTNGITPVTTSAGGTNWKQVSAGNANVAAIKTDGTLWVWGDGSTVKLGTNDTVSKSTPVTTFAGGTNWKQVSAGGSHTAAIKTDGTLWVWGNGDLGKLGTNDTLNKSTPVTTFAGGNNWKQISSGNTHTSAIKTDGTLWTWGNGGLGKLGDNNTLNRSIPVTTFAGGNNWKQVSSGWFHTTSIKTDGTLWIWGMGADGVLGTNSTLFKSTPVTTFAGGTNWKQVDAGYRNTTAIKTDGTLWTWGFGYRGRLGTNDENTIRSTPVTTFAGGSNWKQSSCGYINSAAVQAGTSADLPFS